MAFVLSSPSTARAQSDGMIAVGAQVSMQSPMNPNARGGTDIEVLARLGHPTTGWGWDWALLNWFSTDISRPIGGAPLDLGELHVKPLMGGYAYTHVNGRWSVSTSLLGGYAFTRF